MKKAISIIFAVMIIGGLFTGCSRNKDNNDTQSPGDATSSNGSLVSDISSMMDSGNMSSMKDDVSSVKDDVSSFISSIT